MSNCVKYCIEFTNTDTLNLAECGVGDGITAYFALSTIKKELGNGNFTMHLYDSWNAIRKEDVTQIEIKGEGRYSNLEIKKAKQNLSEFKDNITWHHGYIPEVFKKNSKDPEEIAFLHIDLNSASPTLYSLEYFFDKMTHGSIILFDDYGREGYIDTRNVIKKFFSKKSGILSILPTGQAVFYVNKSV